MDQIVTNVMLNARDALGAIGNITVQTSIVEVGSDESAHADLARGRYACLKITDDGEGMSESILERVFEPFFTTKKIGEGTGLGLAMVYGAVKQNRGEVAITSTQGKGTQVEINLPL
jgi:signal transduction histidine kinase